MTYPSKLEDYRSPEEFAFSLWLREAEDYKLVDKVVYEPRAYLLSAKKTTSYQVKLKTCFRKKSKHLFNKHVYTPDFEFWITDPRLDKYFISSGFLKTKKIMVDVKGKYHPHGALKIFSMNQKWMYEVFGYYVDKIIPDDFFQKTFVPVIHRRTPKQKKIKVKFKNTLGIDGFLKKE